MNEKKTESVEDNSTGDVKAAIRARRDDVRKKISIAHEILADNEVPIEIADKDKLKVSFEARLVATVFSVLVLGILFTWYLWEDRYLRHEDDFIYNLGLIGGILMLLQFVYAIRKRTSSMRRWGLLSKWFSVHTFIGLTAPVIIIVHSRFEMLSINGTVALIAMLIVVLSGMVGRYLYGQVNFDLAMSKRNLKELHGELRKKILIPYSSRLFNMEKELKDFTISAIATPSGFSPATMQAIKVSVQSKFLYMRLSRMKLSQPVGVGTNTMTMDISVFGHVEKDLLKKYIKLLAYMSRYSAYKQLFSMWRIVHIPVIYLLLITGLAHVLAVHMY